MDCTFTSINICVPSTGSKRAVNGKMSVADRSCVSGERGLMLTCSDEAIRGTGERSPESAAVFQRRATMFLNPDEVREIVRAAARIGIHADAPLKQARTDLKLVKK